MKNQWIAVLGVLLLAFSISGCSTDDTQNSPEPQIPSSIAEPQDSGASSTISVESEPAVSVESSEEPTSAEEESESGFLADARAYLALLDGGTFADVYALDSGQKMYFSYNYGFYSSLALLDYTIITNDYPDINDWALLEGELNELDANNVDRSYNFEQGRYKMEDFPVRTVYISGDNLIDLYGESITLEDMEEILGAKIETEVNEMSGMLNGKPVEIEDYLVEVYFSPDNMVSSIAISNR